MENLNYLLKAKNTSIITYELKGSEINRYIKNKENSRVLMDTNFVEDFGGEPLPLDQKIYTLFLCSISNDTKICRNMEVIDYSLLCIIIDYKEDEAFHWDYSDDCYLVYSLGEGNTHSHPESPRVFRPTKPVPKSLRAKLKAKYEEQLREEEEWKKQKELEKNN